MKKEIICFDERFKKIEDIIDRHYDNGAFYESLLVSVLDRGIPESYSPGCDRVIAASVGCGNFIRDNVVVEGLHLLRSEEKKEVYLVGMDCQEILYQRNDHDVELRGCAGNALSTYPWLKGLHESGSDAGSYDYIQFINPDIPTCSDWGMIYERAADFLSPGGVIATVCHGTDSPYLVTLANSLKERLDVGKVRKFAFESILGDDDVWETRTFCFVSMEHKR